MKHVFTLSFLLLSMLALCVPPDTTLHRFVNGSPSVTASEWASNKRNVRVWSPDSALQYTFEEVQGSYRVSVRFQYHSNGAVKTAVQTTHPGASRFWTESTVTFSTDNHPLWMRSEQLPKSSNSVLAGAKNVRYWNPKKRQWQAQETTECQPVPHDFR